MSPSKPKGVLQKLLRAPVYLYHWHCGWLLDHRFLLLTHTGRHTGLRHETVLEVMDFRKDGPEVVVMSGFGRHSDWLLNIEAQPDPEITIGARHFVATYRMLDDDEAVQVVRGYERRNGFMAPVVRWVLSLLLGWTYNGSESARRRLVQELPLIGFKPRT